MMTVVATAVQGFEEKYAFYRNILGTAELQHWFFWQLPSFYSSHCEFNRSSVN